MANLGNAQAQKILEDVSRRRRIPVRAIRSASRYKEHVAARLEVAQRAKDEGILVHVIAEVLNRDWSTIAYHLRKK